MKMWNVYAQQHEGIVLRILPNLEKNSKYALFRPVEYREKRPPLYDSAISFLEGGFFDDQVTRAKTLIDKIIYTKTVKWEYEKELRLVIPTRVGHEWNVMPFHPEEIYELFLGGKINRDVRREVVDLAKSLNPQITIFQAVKGSTEVSFFLDD